MPSHHTSTVVGERGVREHGVALEGVDRVRVRPLVGARRNPEEPELRVDRVQASLGTELHPRDVVADRLDLPPGNGRDQHREVGLAAGRRERGGEVPHAPLRARDLQHEHVLGEPTFVARDDRRDPQREALLAEQGVAAVPGSERPDLARLGEVHDPLLVGVARPGDIGLAGSERRAHRVHARARTSPSGPSTSSAACPARVIVRMLTAT